MTLQDTFAPRRLQSLCRLAAYVLLVEYGLNTILSALPITFQPERLLGQVAALLDTASLPVLAVVLLYGGLVGVLRPARWEWALARAIRPLLLVAVLLFVLVVPAVWGLGGRIQASGDNALRQQGRQVLAQLGEVRKLVDAAPDSRSLRLLIEGQPELRQAIGTPDSPFRDPQATLPQQQQRTNLLLDRIAGNLTAASQQRRSDAAGELRKQQLRLSVMALLHGLFFLLAWLIWPNALSSQPPQNQSVELDDLDDA